MHFVFAAHGTWGDVGPMAEVAVRLQQNGARITFISTPWFDQGLRARGLSTVLVGPHWDPSSALADPRLSHPLTGPINIWRIVFAPLVAPIFDATVAALEVERGVVVLHPWCLGAQLGAEFVQAPWTVVALAPITWFSVDDPATTSPYDLPEWLLRAIMRGPIHRTVRSFFAPTLDEEAKRRGLPAHADRFFMAMRSAALNLAFWPPQFRAPAADDPSHSVQCGFPSIARRDEPLAPKLESFLCAGSAPIVVGLGSALPALAQDVYDQIEQAALALGQRVVLVGATRDSTRDGVLCIQYAPYGSLFRRARIVVHHGGIGTTAEALSAGRPQLVIPFGADQYDNAVRLERLGVAKRIPRSNVSSKRAQRLLAVLIEREADFSRAASDIARSIDSSRPAIDIAFEALLQVAESM